MILLKELGRVYEEKGSLTMAEVTYKKNAQYRPRTTISMVETWVNV
jgi:hypothetical protein